MSTGEITRIYQQAETYQPPRQIGTMHTVMWHDVDHDGDQLYVADIANDRVFALNITTGILTWSWNADRAFSRTSGGPYPYDWTHVNDVEVLADGRIMVSIRNQDQVIFLDPETGMIEDWTLGSDDAHDVLHHQHNPDYIPTGHGGPSVLIGDSTNDRIVEYQRVRGDWMRTWIWQDERMFWPRDADRLPNGNTLVTDSHGDRVFEVDPSGKIVWSVNVTHPYESERLGTSDESGGGESAAKLSLVNRTVAATQGDARKPLLERIKRPFLNVIPNRWVHALMWSLPAWMSFYQFSILIMICVASIAWISLEIMWSSYSLRTPIRLE